MASSLGERTGNRGALHTAALVGDTKFCAFLVDEIGLPVDAKDDMGQTPLMLAMREGHLQTAKFLRDRGAAESTDNTDDEEDDASTGDTDEDAAPAMGNKQPCPSPHAKLSITSSMPN
jgi:hypothetical protein